MMAWLRRVWNWLMAPSERELMDRVRDERFGDGYVPLDKDDTQA
jgi:hypothetical protein